MSRRFDRTAAGRLHFASALTMLSRTDGGDDGSYLHMAEFLMREGAHPERDLEQLWRRIVFNVCVSNTDDHFRNHGFILDPPGWALAPAYDMNPFPSGNGLTLNISETDNAQDLALVRDVSADFRITAERAEQIIAEVMTALRDWRSCASSFGLSGEAQARMARAFRVVEGDH